MDSNQCKDILNRMVDITIKDVAPKKYLQIAIPRNCSFKAKSFRGVDIIRINKGWIEDDRFFIYDKRNAPFTMEKATIKDIVLDKIKRKRYG